MVTAGLVACVNEVECGGRVDLRNVKMHVFYLFVVSFLLLLDELHSVLDCALHLGLRRVNRAVTVPAPCDDCDRGFALLLRLRHGALFHCGLGVVEYWACVIHHGGGTRMLLDFFALGL